MKEVARFGVAAAMFLVLVAGWGSSAVAAIEVEGDAYVGVFDKYLWRGFNLSGSQPVAQGGADFSANGFTLSFWSNAQLKNDSDEGYDAGEINETDIILDYSFDIGETAWVSVGNMHYSLDAAEDTNELYLSVGLNVLLNPSLTVYWDWDKSEADGLYYVFSIGHDIELTDALSIGLTASAAYNQENYSVDESYSEWHNAELGLTVDYAVTEQLSLSPSFTYSTPLSDEADDNAGIDDEMAAGLTVTFNF